MAIKSLMGDDEFLEKWVMITNDWDLDAVSLSKKLVETMGNMKSTVVPKFVTFLAKKKRLISLKKIVNQFVTTLYQQQSIAPVTVKSAQRLTEAQQASIKAKMKAKLGVQDIKLIQEVDASLLAGFFLEWGYVDPEAEVAVQRHRPHSQEPIAEVCLAAGCHGQRVSRL
ncbi:unnamed protein product [Polarella glacialis]|uniref:Uncharacterized protein n=1 Tax=Polarella glacialis TaxID=89957 RepID=A0A813EB50_POLGL|nr:unnamed protein product [Polarella glacialis]